jgi:hypothetical protein
VVRGNAFASVSWLAEGTRCAGALNCSAIFCSRSSPFVSKFERGARRLDVIEFLDVAHALDVDPAQLIVDLDSR